MSRTEEKDFQQVADEYAHGAIESIKEMMDALDHAGECNGKVECDTCNGIGEDDDLETEDKTCTLCKGTGEIDCKEGAQSDNPEAWHDEERARERIQEDPLEVQVRGGWHSPGDDEAAKPEEYYILLGTGGPASRIVGDLDQYGQPKSARFEYQDWFKPWTMANTTSEEDDILLRYAQQFYFES